MIWIQNSIEFAKMCKQQACICITCWYSNVFHLYTNVPLYTLGMERLIIDYNLARRSIRNPTMDIELIFHQWGYLELEEILTLWYIHQKNKFHFSFNTLTSDLGIGHKEGRKQSCFRFKWLFLCVFMLCFFPFVWKRVASNWTDMCQTTAFGKGLHFLVYLD